MGWTNSITLLLSIAGAYSHGILSGLQMTEEFSSPSYSYSAEGKAACVAGNISVTTNATNVRLLLESPANQEQSTEFLVEILQAGGSFVKKVTSGGRSSVGGTFSIYSKLCVPNNASTLSTLQTVQLLTHGATLDHTYWDFAQGYSYVDAAAEAGYATFLYDRLGTGLSERPDPIQVVQAPLQVEIIHALVQKLRNTNIGGRKFKNIVGVGHSAGCYMTQGVTTKYPKDFDAAILTGVSANMDYLQIAQASFGFMPAHLDPSGRFMGLDNGYVTEAPYPGATQFGFWRYPAYEQRIFERLTTTKQTHTFGEILTFFADSVPSASFTGPVDVVLGVNDYVFCGGNCTLPTNQAQLYIETFYPAATKSATFLQPRAGHVNAMHKTRKQGFDQQNEFLRANGF